MDSDEIDCFQMMENLHKNIEKLQGGLFKNVCWKALRPEPLANDYSIEPSAGRDEKQKQIIPGHIQYGFWSE